MVHHGKKIVLGVTGSIAAYKAGDIIRRLQQDGHDVTVVMTKEAEQFITPLTLSALSGKPVYRDMFESAAWAMPHIDLAKQDVLLIAPATANIIGKLAHGIADDLLTCIAITTRSPIVLAPAMNQEMYTNGIVQDNCRKLQTLGCRFIDPIEGKLACGVDGKGHLASVETIVAAINSLK